MAKRRHTVSLNFVLIRFAVGMLVTMLFCVMVWRIGMYKLEENGIVCSGSEINHQVENILGESVGKFTAPDEKFPGEYVLYDAKGKVVQTNVRGEQVKDRETFSEISGYSAHLSKCSYQDGSTALVRWHFRKEFTDPALRRKLPSAETLGLVFLGIGLVSCLVFHTMWLRKYLAKRLRLFGEISKKVGAQELDFTVPCAGIREYDEALDAMEEMRKALYDALSSQWAAQQQREEEIAALAHDLKTPLTLVGGNAELLLEESLPEESRRLVEKILAGTARAKAYVASLLETSAGREEPFQQTNLCELFEWLWENTLAVAEARGVFVEANTQLEGCRTIQKERLQRAFLNILLNAVEHTPEGKTVFLTGSMTENGWQICVRDEGEGFDEAAFQHATERLWRGDPSRRMDGHHGLGLWSAAQTVSAHKGELRLKNWSRGGEVVVQFADGK